MGVSNENEKIDALNKIDKAKGLLDAGAISQEEFDKIKSKCLKQVCENNDKPHQQADYAGSDFEDILGTVISNQAQTKGRRPKKTTSQKAMERAATQAAGTAAREITKGFMRGIFGQMK